MIQLITTWIEQNLSVSADAQTKIFYSLVVIFSLFILRALANRVLKQAH
jgi:hypothetical protein